MSRRDWPAWRWRAEAWSAFSGYTARVAGVFNRLHHLCVHRAALHVPQLYGPRDPFYCAGNALTPLGRIYCRRHMPGKWDGPHVGVTPDFRAWCWASGDVDAVPYTPGRRCILLVSKPGEDVVECALDSGHDGACSPASTTTPEGR